MEGSGDLAWPSDKSVTSREPSMPPTSCQSEFTIATANDTLPLVKMIVGDIVEISEDISETRDRLSHLRRKRARSAEDDYGQELKSIVQLTDEKSQRLDAFIDELLALNVDPNNAEAGYVDFPATRDSEEIRLCWHLGEPEVMYWHRSDEDCQRRRLVDLPLVQNSVRGQSSSA